MRANSLIESYDYGKRDGFELIPRNPKKVFLLKVHPLLDHLPTKLAGSRTGKWRVPSALAKMDFDSVVILWQDGPNAGIYGIAVPQGDSFMTNTSIFQPASHLEFYRYGFREAKLRCVYIPPTPILLKTLISEEVLVSEIKRPRAQLKTGCKLTKQTWSDLYDLLEKGRDSTYASAVEYVLERPDAIRNPVVEFIQRLEQCVPSGEDNANSDANGNTNRASSLSDPYALAQQIWIMLTQSAATKTRVHANTLSPLFGVSPGQVHTAIDLINKICTLENLPPLASMTLSNFESADLYAQPLSISHAPLMQQFISMPENGAANNYDWNQIPNPFDFTLQMSSENIIRELRKNPVAEQAEDIYKLIKVRGTAQQIFARLIRGLYDRQCAFCGFSVPFALEAAHIKPWPFCTPGERLLPSNGLLLCAVHHKLFDAGLITLSVDPKARSARRFIVKVLAANSILSLSQADIDFVKKIDGVNARLPLRIEHRPSLEFLNFRKNWVAEKISHKAPQLHLDYAEHFY